MSVFSEAMTIITLLAGAAALFAGDNFALAAMFVALSVWFKLDRWSP